VVARHESRVAVCISMAAAARINDGAPSRSAGVGAARVRGDRGCWATDSEASPHPFMVNAFPLMPLSVGTYRLQPVSLFAVGQ
jgi:hypothetical protein